MRLLGDFAVTVVIVASFVTSTQGGNLRGSVNVPKYNCGAPTSIYQGSVKYSSTAPGSTATYTCMKGTNMKGPATIRCSNQGIWSPQPPECRVTYLTSRDNTFKNHDTGYVLYSG
ncbi:hypothetical protein PF005_g13591 [Phytophthora fragariae]|uniref:Sushi domain-containing protein n=2 Tax=Phytophthora TaxID=4783 RepID=A0A6A3RYH7_9STRA|nr:hypothetical protein PF003_g434 [Phytophthora fragariae]KAE8981486.1 hypothetical protein PR002_g23814 [Phytophthora rubi]KAE8935439.1 hypothetical protein PF009_g14608 [Phytophthora fragariae]KAE8983661.1 hypothetical protein PR001_g23390 [Phytophthora rubi]KAE9004371.1 hypothetical protein PF011_g12479 [Phytophthora fragariae]